MEGEAEEGMADEDSLERRGEDEDDMTRDKRRSLRSKHGAENSQSGMGR